MPLAPVIKLSSPATKEFWEIPILHEDDSMLAISKPAALLSSPDRHDPERPNLMRLLHRDIERGAAWARDRSITYLANVHRLDFETTGVFLLAKTKPALIDLANQFGSEKPHKHYVALAWGDPSEETFVVDVKLGPDPRSPGKMRWTKDGKKSLTQFRVMERFQRVTLIECRPYTGRTHQIRVHLKFAGHSICGDAGYGSGPLMLSQIKSDYRLKRGHEERPLTPTLALHAWKLEVIHPVTRLPVKMEAPWPKDLNVAVKYLRRYLMPSATGGVSHEDLPSSEIENRGQDAE